MEEGREGFVFSFCFCFFSCFGLRIAVSNFILLIIRLVVSTPYFFFFNNIGFVDGLMVSYLLNLGWNLIR